MIMTAVLMLLSTLLTFSVSVEINGSLFLNNTKTVPITSTVLFLVIYRYLLPFMKKQENFCETIMVGKSTT